MTTRTTATAITSLSLTAPKQHFFSVSPINDEDNNNEDEDENNKKAAQLRAKQLKEYAEKARSEAQQMEMDLVNSKLSKLREMLERKTSSKASLSSSSSSSSRNDESTRDIQDRIDRLQTYLDPPLTSGDKEKDKGGVSADDAADADATADDNEQKKIKEKEKFVELTDEDEELLGIFNAFKFLLTTEGINDLNVLDFLTEFETEMFAGNNNNNNQTTRRSSNVTQDKLDDYLAIKKVAKTALGFIKSYVGFAGISFDDLKGNVTEELRERSERIKQDPKYSTRLEALQFQFPNRFFAKYNNFATGLDKEQINKLQLEESKAVNDFCNLILKPLNNTAGGLCGMLPPLSSDDDDVDDEKPRKLGATHLLILQRSSSFPNGDELLAQIDAQVKKQKKEKVYHDTFEYFYFRDQSDIYSSDFTEEELASKMASKIILENSLDTDKAGRVKNADISVLAKSFEQLSYPALLLVPKDSNSDDSRIDLLAPETGHGERAAISFLTVGLTASFAAECYINSVTGSVGGGFDSIPTLLQQFATGLTSPIFLGILGIQLLHEFGHFVVAALNKFEISFPFAMIPSPSTGLLHTNTQFKTPPPNNNALFDFAALGPVLGMSASWAALVTGLSLTASTKTNQIPALPHVPLDFIQLSSLTSATIESLMGTDVLLSLDPLSDNVAVHPLVIAGHVGILVNALNLLPVASSLDGGRMARALGINFVQGFFRLFLVVQVFREWDSSSNLLLLFTFLMLFQPEDLPCRNSVDKADGTLRLPLFVATSVLTVLALSPAF